MKTILLAMFTLSNAAAEPAIAPSPAAKAAPSLRARLTDEAIRSAVRETLAQNGPGAEPAPSGTVLSGGAFRSFAHEVAESKKPPCLGSDALKFQPAKSDTRDWHFEAKGLTAAPFWAAAILRRKCN